MRQQPTSIEGPRRPIIRLLGISGSLRSGSFSTAILQSLALRRRPDEEMSVLTLDKVPFYNEDEDNHPALPAVEELRSTIAGSDGVIIATPEYNHGVPGVLKNALDWGSRPTFQSCFVNKPVLILSSSPAFTGGVRAQYQLREALTSMQARVVSGREIVIAGVNGKMKDGLLADEEVLRFIEDGVRRLRGEIHAAGDVAA